MLKTVADFLAAGYDQKAAEYFAAGPKTLLDAFPLTDYRLLLTYEGGEKRIYNVKPLIQPGTVFEFLTDPEVFLRVYVDETHSVCWDKNPALDSNVFWTNRVDLDPDTCYIDSKPAANQQPA